MDDGEEEEAKADEDEVDEDDIEELGAAASEDEAEAEDSDTDSSDEEEIDPGPWKDDDVWVGTADYTKPRKGLHIAHKFFKKKDGSGGWEVGRIKKKSGKDWSVTYDSEIYPYGHDLKASDYGTVWLAVKRK